jgi:hypothetical protein
VPSRERACYWPPLISTEARRVVVVAESREEARRQPAADDDLEEHLAGAAVVLVVALIRSMHGHAKVLNAPQHRRAAAAVRLLTSKIYAFSRSGFQSASPVRDGQGSQESLGGAEWIYSAIGFFLLVAWLADYPRDSSYMELGTTCRKTSLVCFLHFSNSFDYLQCEMSQIG